MSKSKERKRKDVERRYEKYGYFGFFTIKDVIPFQLWMQDARRGFRLHVTEGNELAVLYKDGIYIRIWFDAELHRCCCNRLGMGMYLTWRYHALGIVG